MRTWIRPFLRTLWDEKILSRESFEEEICTPLFAGRRLASLFRTSNFTQRLTDTFGGVLADLPEEVFSELLAIRNLFFFLPKSLGFVQGLNFTENRPAILCSFSERLLELSDAVVMGTISHELAHISLKHYEAGVQGLQTTAGREVAADQRAIEWGFEFEIQAVRDFLKSISLI